MRESLIEILGLKEIARTGWVRNDVNNPESVAGKSLIDLKSKTKSIGGKLEQYIKCCQDLSILKDIDNPLNISFIVSYLWVSSSKLI